MHQGSREHNERQEAHTPLLFEELAFIERQLIVVFLLLLLVIIFVLLFLVIHVLLFVFVLHDNIQSLA